MNREWQNKLQDSHIKDYYRATKITKPPIQGAALINLMGIMLSQRSYLQNQPMVLSVSIATGFEERME